MRRFLIHIMLLVIPCGAIAQEYAYRKYSIYDGLVQMQIQKVFQDSRGYLWIGTKVGVSKFNGERFVNFREKDGLPGSFVSDIKEDSAGNIWFSTTNGLARYDGVKMVAYPYTLAQSDFIIDRDNKVWLIGENQKLIKFNGHDYELIGFDNPSLQNARIGDIYYDNKEELILLWVDSLGCFSLKENNLEKVFPANTLSLGFNKAISNKLYLEGPRFSEQKYVFEWKDGRFEKVLEWEKEILAFENLSKDYYFTQDRNFYRVEKGAKTIEKLFSSTYFGLKLEYVDEEGNFWLGSEEGLVHYFGQTFQNYALPGFNNVWSIVEDNSGTMWLGSYGNGLYKYDGIVARELSDYFDLEVINQYSEENKRAFYFQARKDKNGNLFFPHSAGIIKYDGNDYTLIRSLSCSSCSTTALILFYDKDQDQFLAGIQHGIMVFNDKGEKRYWGKEHGIHENNFIAGIGKDKNGHYWLGSFSGLSRVILEKDTIIVNNYTSENGQLPSSGVIAVFKDYAGNMWFGSRNGLLFYDYETDSIRSVLRNELNLDVTTIIDIDSTHLLIGATDGLYVLDLNQFYNSSDYHFKYFNHKNGFLGVEVNQNGFFKDSKGNIWVPSATITVKINPVNLNMEVIPLKTHINAINEKMISYATDTTIFIPEGTNEVKLKFEAIGFSRPLDTKYSFFLEGKSKDWSDWQEGNFAFFSNLGSGEYTFKVKAKTVGVDEALMVPGIVKFKVSVSFWQEPNFYKYAIGIAILSISLILFLILRNYMERINARENERKAKHFEIQTLQAQMNPHFIFNVLGTLQNLILNSNPQKANEHLIKLAKLMRRFLESSIQSTMPQKKSSESEVSLEKEIELLRMYIDFERLQYEGIFDYEIITPPELNAFSVTIPPMIIQPFVENAVKHGLRYKEDRGFLSIRFSEVGETISCTVMDNGVGREKAREIQKRSIRMYKSHGTSLVKKRIKVLNSIGYQIRIETSDKEGGGTIVKIIIARE